LFQGFDPSAAFFTQVKNKKKPGAGGDQAPKPTNSQHVGKAAEENVSTVLSSSVMQKQNDAVLGPSFALKG
jgi:hypothetical protein